MIVYIPTRVKELPSRRELALYAARGYTLRELAHMLRVDLRQLIYHVAEVYPEYNWMSLVARKRKVRVNAFNSLLATLRAGLKPSDEKMARWKRQFLASLPPTTMHLLWGKTLAILHPAIHEEVMRLELMLKLANGEPVSDQVIKDRVGAPKAVAKAIWGLPLSEGEKEVWRAWTRQHHGRGIPGFSLGRAQPLRRSPRQVESQSDSGNGED